MATPQKSQQLNPGPCEGFDEFAGQRWVYPNNMPVRGYQKAAVEMALFHNAMIVLPTGFGKTFIAAVVMYNFYNWYPQGTIIFVAPTKPLVAQQIEECKKVSGIPSSACVEITGMVSIEKRRQLLKERRVIFATPQVIENDLEQGILKSKSVRCIVIDEAHKAQGNYSYVNIVRKLQEDNRNGFRILALSATPGTDMTRVQQVMLNLYINDIMFRTETSIDLMQYRNEKCSRAWTVELTGKHKEMVDSFIKLTEPIFKDLYRAGLTYGNDSIERVAKYTLIKIMSGEYNGQQLQAGMTKGKLMFSASVGIGLLSLFESLTLYGLRVFYSSVVKVMSETKSNVRRFLAPKVEFEKIKQTIETLFGEDVCPDSDKKSSKNLLLGHPKLAVTKDLLMKHFVENHEKKETRAIVFTKYRESVMDIVQTLKAFDPMLKPVPFVGQSSGKGNTGMSQKEQAKVIADFKSGVYNTIVATCVAEEGLDIGEVDLIIAYDTSSSISTTQRRGRTGRKRSGNCHSILTKGYEEKRLKKAGETRRQIEDQLYKKENYSSHKYLDAPRMVPRHINPVCFEHKVFPVDDDVQEEPDGASKSKRRRTTKVVATSASTKKGKKAMSQESLKMSCTDGSESGGGCETSFKSAADFMASDWPDSSPDCLWD